MRTPHGIWLDNRPGREPSLVVADRANARLQYFTLDGKFLSIVNGVSFPAHFDIRGTDLLVIGDFKLRPSFPGEPEAPADAEARWRGLINNVRGIYRGQIGFELLMGDALWPNPPAFLDAVDVVHTDDGFGHAAPDLSRSDRSAQRVLTVYERAMRVAPQATWRQGFA